ncbi:MAG: hypothetical protein ABSD28_15405 [Tepidisphaeraceae bacterium]|jgi:hypothetical protein
MATPSQSIELPLTLHVSEQTKDALVERAAASGTDLAGYLSVIAEQTVQRPMSLEQICGPVYQNFLDSGMTDDELSDVLEKEKHLARAKRRAGQAP